MLFVLQTSVEAAKMRSGASNFWGRGVQRWTGVGRSLTASGLEQMSDLVVRPPGIWSDCGLRFHRLVDAEAYRQVRSNRAYVDCWHEVPQLVHVTRTPPTAPVQGVSPGPGSNR